MQYISVLGLLLIAAAWLLQYMAMKGGKQQITRNFVAVNCVGIALLIIDGAMSGSYEIAAMNVLTLAGSLLTASRIK